VRHDAAGLDQDGGRDHEAVDAHSAGWQFFGHDHSGDREWSSPVISGSDSCALNTPTAGPPQARSDTGFEHVFHSTVREPYSPRQTM
jgi:hypothetical protein